MGTLQAGYTDFKYLTQATKNITEREALLGVGMTGWMANPDLLFDEELLIRGAKKVLETNKIVAAMIGINPAARACTVKPSGNASVLLKTSSGIHGVHAPRYIRNMNINEESEILKKILEVNPKMCRKALGNNNGTDICVSFPIETPNAIYNKDLKGVKLLERVRMVQRTWIEAGTDIELCVDPKLRHNVSNTVTVDNWDEVEEYLYENRADFAGVSLMGEWGDKGFAQAPFTEVLTMEEICNAYGTGSMFGSGLIVDALHVFNNDLYAACQHGVDDGINLTDDTSELVLKRDWVRRLHKFARKHFNSDVIKATHCLKDIYNLHHWETLIDCIEPIDFRGVLTKPRYTEVDTMGAAACAGGMCELPQ